MRISRIHIAIAVLLFMGSASAEADRDSCYCKPDSINFPQTIVDTCGTRVTNFGGCEPCLRAATLFATGYLERIYAPRLYDIELGFKPVRSPVMVGDSLVRFTWNDIDTTYAEFRAFMQEIEGRFGKYHFYVGNPVFPDYYYYYVEFEFPARADSVVGMLGNTSYVLYAGYKGPECLMGSVSRPFDDSRIVIGIDAERLRVSSEKSGIPLHSIEVLDIAGRLRHRWSDGTLYHIEISTETWSSGLYFLLINTSFIKPVIIIR